MNNCNQTVDDDLLILRMKLNKTELDIFADSGAWYNLIDMQTTKRLQSQF